MTSNIDVTQPPEGRAYTQGVRDNFVIIKDEIETLQDTIDQLQGTLGGMYLPITGGRITGSLNVDGSILGTAQTAPIVISDGDRSGLPIQFANNIFTVTRDAGQVRQFMLGWGGAPQLCFARPGGTKQAPLPSSAAAVNISMFGYDGVAWTGSPNATYTQSAGNPWTPTDHSTFHAWQVTPLGSITPAEQMRLDPSGSLLIGKNVNNGPERIQVNGQISVNADPASPLQVATKQYVDASGGVILAPVITAGALALDFANNGVFRVALNANITAITIANSPANKVITRQLELVADGTARTINFGAWTIVTGTPMPTSAAGRKDVYEIRSDGTHVLVWLTAQNVPA